ncbi:HDIG domain-containing protein [Coprothermobacteraceae bacterium]|nr:HDIG domain-containing protein [Coprothermobacteraceae bacterium]
MKGIRRYSYYLALYLAGAILLFAGLMPLKAPVKEGVFTQSVVSDRNLYLTWPSSSEGRLLIRDEIRVQDYAERLSRMASVVADSRVASALGRLSAYIRQNGLYAHEVPLTPEILQDYLDLDKEVAQRLADVLQGVVDKPTWVERPADVNSVLSVAQSVAVPVGTPVGVQGDRLQSVQAEALRLMGYWIPTRWLLPSTHWFLVLMLPVLWLLVSWWSDVLRSYGKVFYFAFGILSALGFMYFYRFSGLLMIFPLWLYAYVVLSNKLSRNGLWAVLIPVAVFGALQVPFNVYAWLALFMTVVFAHRLAQRLFTYETMVTAWSLVFLSMFSVQLLWVYGSGVRGFQGLWYAFTDTLVGLVATLFLVFLAFWWEDRRGFLTPFGILRLSNLRHPLLQGLAMEAPGTYHHSVVLSQMTEEAASAVGGNKVLARLGALYHDIGKIKQPEYFIENNPDAPKLHERLSPSLSMLILLSHVKEGLALADKYRLPDSIREFIASHHGTGVASFFYHKAKTQGKEVSSEEFRYPGPLPRGKEASILMLADACEAAVRSLPEKTEAAIGATVKNIIKARLDDGQLSESSLSCQDLCLVERSFVRILAGLYHPRVQYPGGAEQ